MTTLLAVTAVVVIGYGAAIPWVFYLERKQRERANAKPLTDADIEARLADMEQSLAEMQAYLRRRRQDEQP